MQMRMAQFRAKNALERKELLEARGEGIRCTLKWKRWPQLGAWTVHPCATWEGRA